MQRDSKTEEKIKVFLSYIEPQKEAGLVIASDSASLIETEKLLKKSGFQEAKTPIEVVDYLSNQKSVYTVLHSPLSKDFYDMVTQYTDRGGMIQLMDKSTMDFRSVQFDPKVSHLILMTLKENLIEIEKVFPLRDKVGMVEQI